MFRGGVTLFSIGDLYQRFFLRDVFGKIIPGGIAFIGFEQACFGSIMGGRSLDWYDHFSTLTKLIVTGALIATFYLLGILGQSVFEQLFSGERDELSSKRLASICTRFCVGSNEMMQRDRFVLFKEISTNMFWSLALFLALSLLALPMGNVLPGLELSLAVMLAITATLFFLASRYYKKKQRDFENAMLNYVQSKKSRC